MFSHPESDERDDRSPDDVPIAPASTLPTFEEKPGEPATLHDTVPLSEERKQELHEESQKVSAEQLRIAETFERQRKDHKAHMERLEKIRVMAVKTLELGHETVARECRIFYRLKTGKMVWKTSEGLILKEEPMKKVDYDKVRSLPRK